MPFAICFTDEPNQFLGDDPTVPYAVGRILAGCLDESFVATLYEWDRRDYEAQWLLALERLVAGDRKVVLTTYYVNPAESSNLEWWALYRGDDDVVHVQNHLRFYNQLGSGFSIAEASRFVQERLTIDEDGNHISEWDVTLTEIKLFIEQVKRQKRDTSP